MSSLAVLVSVFICLSFCCQITIEPPLGLRANLLVAYSSKPISQDNFYYPEEKEEEIERRATEFQRLVYGLAFFHGVVLERHRYGPTGWNGSYTFNMSDLRISLNQLRDILFKVSTGCNIIYGLKYWRMDNVLLLYHPVSMAILIFFKLQCTLHSYSVCILKF